MSNDHDRLLDRRNRLMHEYSGDAFRDGLVSQAIAKIDAEVERDPETDEPTPAEREAAEKAIREAEAEGDAGPYSEP